MSLTDEDRRSIVEYRIEKAYKAFEEAQKVSSLQLWSLAANRLYYTLYHASSALLIKNGHVARTHTGIITLISKEYILSGRLTPEDGKLLGRLFRLRQESEYDDFFDATEEEISTYTPQVKELLDKLVALTAS